MILMRNNRTCYKNIRYPRRRRNLIKGSW